MFREVLVNQFQELTSKIHCNGCVEWWVVVDNLPFALFLLRLVLRLLEAQFVLVPTRV